MAIYFILVYHLDKYDFKLQLTCIYFPLAIPYIGGWTNTYEALYFARTKVFNTYADRPGVTNAVFFISDGVPTRPEPESGSRQNALNESVLLKNTPATVFR